MLTKYLLSTVVVCGIATAQYAPSVSGSTVAAAEINSKPAIQYGSGAPSSLNCTSGKDFYVDTSAHALYQCSVTGTPGTWILNALTTNPLSQFAATTSAQLAGVLSDETGSGAAVFANGPTITLPNATGLPLSTGVIGILPAANGGTGIANSTTMTLGTSPVNLATLGTGIMKNTTMTGALTIAAAGVDYAAAIGSSAAGVAFPGTCSNGDLWLVTGAFANPATHPSPGLYTCDGNLFFKLLGSAHETAGLWTGSAYSYTLPDSGSSYTFISQSPNHAIQTTLGVYPAATLHDSTVNLRVNGSNDSSFGTSVFEVQLNGISTRHLFLETFGQGGDLAADSIRYGEYTQSSIPSAPNLTDQQFCFGNALPTAGQYCPYILDKSGNYTRTVSTSVPGTPGAGSSVEYVDPTTKTPTAIDDAGNTTIMVRPFACTGGQHLAAVSAAGVATCN